MCSVLLPEVATHQQLLGHLLSIRHPDRALLFSIGRAGFSGQALKYVPGPEVCLRIFNLHLPQMSPLSPLAPCPLHRWVIPHNMVDRGCILPKPFPARKVTSATS